MRQRLTLLTLILALSVSAFSQLFKVKGKEIGFLYFGPKVGLSGSWMSNASTTGTSSKTLIGYQFGAVGKFGITEKLSVQPEILYSKKGAAQELTGGGESQTIANYLGLPILAKLNFIKIGDFQFHGSGGVYTNVTLSSKSVVEWDTFNEEFDLQSTDYKTVDFGFSVGGGISYDLDFGLLVGELLVEHGAVDMYTDNVMQNSNRNTTITFAATFLFDFVDITTKAIKKKKAE